MNCVHCGGQLKWDINFNKSLVTKVCQKCGSVDGRPPLDSKSKWIPAEIDRREIDYDYSWS